MKINLQKYFRTIATFILPLFAATLAMTQNVNPSITDTVTFRVDMKYMAANGTFHPGTDTLDMIGTMNDWQGSPVMERVDTTLVYKTTYALYAGATYQYKFRINHDSAKIEILPPDTANRWFRCPDTTWTVTSFFNNYNPATVAMTFNCDMYYQIRAAHFVPSVDWLDVAGNFNNNDGYDVLFEKSTDSIYSVTIYFDTTMIGDTLKFKFRMNGSWETAELQGDSSRTYKLGPANNEFTCWFNNIDPNVPSLPFVYDLGIQGTLALDQTLTGIYTYEDYNLKPEGKTRYQWYRADSTGGAITPIDTATFINYTVDSASRGKFLVFEVTPLTTDSTVGLPVRVFSTSRIWGVGIEQKDRINAKIYPNPVKELLYIETDAVQETIVIMNAAGQVVKRASGKNHKTSILNLSGLAPGVYYLQIECTGRRFLVKSIVLEK
jgi:hypothetical protein